ncbi:hypothetical protein PDQ75_26220 [Bacillus cereus group sp. Bc015]|uniref:hypothetical protein n=1 Tax=Bacillus cereus group sp. Bc015 TaxID=3018123 RepID=UPI0022E90BE7|nr:hypothetical protein [Bacillus cereus group sp. Bc015]MDA2738638.1 hypothetical protein [Bacillus cereus group sp. Bc015]
MNKRTRKTYSFYIVYNSMIRKGVWLFMSSKNRKSCNPCYQPLGSGFSSTCSNSCSQEGCHNDRIISDAVIHSDSLIIRQDFCVDATVGVAPPPDGVTIQQLIENKIFQYAPGELLPTAPLRLMTVIARNLSNNFVNVAIQRSAPSGLDIPPVTLADATATPNSEVALSAPNANRLIASAEVPSRVRFFITIFFPTDPVSPGDPV